MCKLRNSEVTQLAQGQKVSKKHNQDISLRSSAPNSVLSDTIKNFLSHVEGRHEMKTKNTMLLGLGDWSANMPQNADC